MSDDKPENEIISFKNASEPHINARKDRKLKEVQKAFKALMKYLKPMQRTYLKLRR